MRGGGGEETVEERRWGSKAEETSCFSTNYENNIPSVGTSCR